MSNVIDQLRQVRRSLTAEQQTFMLAMGMIMERLMRLDKEKSDLAVVLFQDLAAAGEDQEERDAAISAIWDLLMPEAPIGVQRLDFDRTVESEKLQKWKDWVSARVREERNAKGITQEQLAELAGIPQSHISRIENARHSPSRATIEKIAKALGVEVCVFDPGC